MFSSELGTDPFENVRMELEGFTDSGVTDGKKGQKGAKTTFHAARYSMEEMKKMQEAYMAEAKRLQEEVNDLEQDLENENMAALSIPSSTLEELRRILKISRDDQGMENMHKMQATLSGVHLTDATTKVTSNNPQHIVRVQRLEGNCSGLGFAAVFEVEEILVESARDEEGSEEGENQEERRAVIRKLDLEVDPQCLGEMVTFLSQAERRCDLQPFLRGYANYARWFQHRSRTFTHFKNLYVETVSLPEGPNGTVLQIVCPQQRGIIYTLTWSIQVADSGRTTPEVNLSVQSIPEVAKLDTKDTLRKAPQEFEKMVLSMGVEKALHSFIRAVTLF